MKEKRFFLSNQNIIRQFRIIFSIMLLLFGFSIHASYAATYYVATTGSDSNPGTLAAPFRTAQKGLNVLKPGDNCMIRSGTYNEALALGQSGTSSARITIQNYPGETVTVNSGNSRALRTNGNKHYYTIDGLRFISNHVVYTGSDDYNISFQDGSAWGGQTSTTAGNNGFILKNCYIEGAIYIYGHNNTVTNCEFNGKAAWGNGIFEAFGASHDNVYSNNKIHDYVNRGVWTMQYTDKVLIEYNTIYNIGTTDTLAMGIDLDAAVNNLNNGIVRGNTIYNCVNAIQLENAFNTIIEANKIYGWNGVGQGYGIKVLNYGMAEGADAEYKNKITNTIIRNNLVIGMGRTGIEVMASPGNKIYNNTIINTTSSSYGSTGAISLADWNGFYSTNTEVVNNIVYNWGTYGLWISAPSSGLTNLKLSNNIYYSQAKTNTHYYLGNTYSLNTFKTSFNQDISSNFIDPQFVNVTTADYHLQKTSPAISFGLNLSQYVTTDIENTQRPSNGNYCVGAYELLNVYGAILPPQNLTVM